MTEPSPGPEKPASPSGSSDLLGRTILCFLILWIPVYSLASIHGDVFSPLPIVYSAGVFAVPALLCAAALGGVERRRRAVLLGVLVAFFLDLQMPGIGSLALVAVAVGLGALFWVLRENVLRILLATFATVLASMVLFPGTRAVPAADRADDVATSEATDVGRGLYLHLLLDEFAGPSGMPMDFEATAAQRTRLVEFMAAYGFSVAEGSRATYYSSVDSISDVLNFGTLDPENPIYSGKHPYVLEQNAYFERLGDVRGALRVVQSDYMDFCTHAPVELAACRTYRHDGMGWIDGDAWDATSKTRILLGIYGNRQGWIEFVMKRVRRTHRALANAGLELPTILAWNGTLAPLNGMEALEQLERDVLAGPADATWFAHLLVPHSPYVFEASCEIRRDPYRWLSNHPRYLKNNDEAGRAIRYAQYAEQMACTLDRLAGFFDALDRAGRLENATILVQGDHGSRISLVPLRDVDREDETVPHARDVYDAIFAIRSPLTRDLPIDAKASLPSLLDGTSLSVLAPDSDEAAGRVAGTDPP